MRIAVAAISTVVTFGALYGCKPGGKAESVAPLYDSAPVENRNIEVTVDAAGVIEAESLVEVKSKASGEVLAVHAEIGDIVQKSTLLIEIDKRTPRNNVAQNEAALAAAKARRAIAKTQLDRANTLYKSQTLTQTDVEKAELEYANADAQVVASDVALENARITLEDTDVRAPITGTIITKSVEPGTVIQSTTQAVSGGTTLMQMADLTNVQIRTRVDETDIGKVQPGMPTKVTVAAYPNQPFDGVVLKIEPQAVVEQNVTMFAVLIKIVNRGGQLKPGMNADVKIRIANRDSVAAVPTAALRAETDVTLSAKMLGVDENQLRRQIWPDGQGVQKADGKNVIALNGGREIQLPDGVDAAQVQALMAKRRNGEELSTDERALMRKVFQNAGFNGGGGGQGGGGFGGGEGGTRTAGGGRPGGGAGGGGAGGGGAGGFGGGGFPGGGFPGGGFPPGGQGGNASPAARPSYYQFGGDYWVIALRNDQPIPVAVKTGLTDLEYSEIVSGLQPGDRVLLLPSTSLFEQQERLQQFITARFSSTPFQQNNQNQQFRGRPPF
ncbi:MAG TPA: efflux RND transporter periplasmic adaptor subunit [Gammaproteobacteria bacterium]|nr:efflux RND transporter periplasmic adaptor subunit [Gammaproteobacteria bacterium]